MQHFLDQSIRFAVGARDKNPGSTRRLLPAEFNVAQRLTPRTDAQQADAGQKTKLAVDETDGVGQKSSLIPGEHAQTAIASCADHY